MAGPRSGAADATAAPAVNDNARPPTATANLVNDSGTIYAHLPTNAPPNASGDHASLAGAAIGRRLAGPVGLFQVASATRIVTFSLEVLW
jgi:hypothetical protein